MRTKQYIVAIPCVVIRTVGQLRRLVRFRTYDVSRFFGAKEIPWAVNLQHHSRWYDLYGRHCCVEDCGCPVYEHSDLEHYLFGHSPNSALLDHSLLMVFSEVKKARDFLAEWSSTLPARSRARAMVQNSINNFLFVGKFINVVKTDEDQKLVEDYKSRQN
ncbi:MAG: hypothetical protein KatS3mg040_1783 [Candidatus Kapaibacterium sp.]|nr:MAG: hypothetical protein KatS3mg040_1783 [Candidatus Kapabacteria bacterium]